MQTEEIWKDIPGYNGRYQASNLGRIRSTGKTVVQKNGVTKSIRGKILHQFMAPSGYLYVTVSAEVGKFCPKRAHRLIAQTFIPNPDNLPQINHKNANKADNRIENLEWCTVEYNTYYGHRIEKYSRANINNPTLSKGVSQYSLDGKYLRSFPSIAEAVRFLNKDKASASRIGQCCRHLYKLCNSAYGYLWEFTTAENEGKNIKPLQQKGFPIYQYSLDGQFIKKWENAKTAAKTLNLSSGNLCKAYTQQKNCGGFKWSTTPLTNKEDFKHLETLFH